MKNSSCGNAIFLFAVSSLAILCLANYAYADTTRDALQKAWAFYYDGNFDQVRALATANSKSGPVGVRAAWLELMAASFHEDPHQAISYAEEAQKLSPHNAHILDTYAYFMSWQPKLLRQAVQVAQNAVAIAPDSGRAHAMLGWTLAKVGDEAKDTEFARAIRLAPNDFDVNEWGSRFYQHSGVDVIAGRACVDRLVSNYPKSPWAWFVRAEFRRKAKDPDGAIQDYSQAIKLQPAYFQAYLGRGRVWQFSRNFNEAIADYTKCLSIARWQGFLFPRAECYEQLHEYDKAIADLSEAIKIVNAPALGDEAYDPSGESRDDRYQRYWLKRAALRNKAGKYDKAAGEATSILKAVPNCVQALDVRQNAWCQLGKYKEALADLTAMIKIDANASTYRTRAELYAKLNRKADADADLAKVKELQQL